MRRVADEPEQNGAVGLNFEVRTNDLVGVGLRDKLIKVRGLRHILHDCEGGRGQKQLIFAVGLKKGTNGPPCPAVGFSRIGSVGYRAPDFSRKKNGVVSFGLHRRRQPPSNRFQRVQVRFPVPPLEDLVKIQPCVAVGLCLFLLLNAEPVRAVGLAKKNAAFFRRFT